MSLGEGGWWVVGGGLYACREVGTVACWVPGAGGAGAECRVQSAECRVLGAGCWTHEYHVLGATNVEKAVSCEHQCSVGWALGGEVGGGRVTDRAWASVVGRRRLYAWRLRICSNLRSDAFEPAANLGSDTNLRTSRLSFPSTTFWTNESTAMPDARGGMHTARCHSIERVACVASSLGMHMPHFRRTAGKHRASHRVQYTHSPLNPAVNMAAAIGRFAKASFAAAKNARITDSMGMLNADLQPPLPRRRGPLGGGMGGRSPANVRTPHARPPTSPRRNRECGLGLSVMLSGR